MALAEQKRWEGSGQDGPAKGLKVTAAHSRLGNSSRGGEVLKHSASKAVARQDVDAAAPSDQSRHREGNAVQRFRQVTLCQQDSTRP